jgi:hypothetical protein
MLHLSWRQSSVQMLLFHDQAAIHFPAAATSYGCEDGDCRTETFKSGRETIPFLL